LIYLFIYLLIDRFDLFPSGSQSHRVAGHMICFQPMTVQCFWRQYSHRYRWHWL